MTMTRSDSSVYYDPDGILDRYLVPFPIFSPDDVYAVLVEGATETPVNDFSVEGLGTEAGVYLRFFTPPPAGRKLVLYRWTKRVQETDYPEGGRFPSKTVEEDFDKLTAMAQEEEDFLQTVVRVPRGAEETPMEYLARFFETAEDAMAARNEARDSAVEAAESAAGANAAAAAAALDAAAAAQSAAEAAETVAEGAPIGSETQKGIVRLATREEHETGEAGIAAQPIYVKSMLDKAIEEHGGLPLLSLLWEASSLDKPGFLRANVSHGLLTRESFPEAAAEVQRRFDTGDSGVVTEAVWLAEYASSGMCAKFSIGNGSTTFRIPFFGANRASLAVAGGGFRVGEYRADQFQGHWHQHYSSVAGNRITNTAGSPANWPSHLGDNNLNGGSTAYIKEPITDGINGAPRTGDITHGRIIGATPYIKMYGAVTESSDANMAALINATTAKLDTARYTADRATEAPLRIAAYMAYAANGTIYESCGATFGLVRQSTGVYRVTSGVIKSNSVVVPVICVRGGSGGSKLRIDTVTNGSCMLRGQLVTSTPFDSDGAILVLNNA